MRIHFIKNSTYVRESTPPNLNSIKSLRDGPFFKTSFGIFFKLCVWTTGTVCSLNFSPLATADECADGEPK